MKARKFAKCILLILAAVMALSACSKAPESTDNTTQSESGTVVPSGPREVQTYLDLTFDELNIGDDLEVDTDYFELYEGNGFVASSKDEDGNVWVQIRDPLKGSLWGLAYTDLYKDGKKYYPKDWCVSIETRNTNTDGSLWIDDQDGGLVILRSPAGPRYDLAIHQDKKTNGGVSDCLEEHVQGTSINLWLATMTEDGPWATTGANDVWGDRGSIVKDICLSPNVNYTITCCGKYQGMNSEGEELFTLYVFVDEYLVIYERDIPYWEGGFGIRGGKSTWEYGYFKVTDFPLVCPDGIDHYTLDNESTVYPPQTFEKLDTPTLKIDGSVVSWDPVENAQGYNLYCDGVHYKYVETTQVDASEIPADCKYLEVNAMPNRFGLNDSDKDIVDVTGLGSKVEVEVPDVLYDLEIDPDEFSDIYFNLKDLIGETEIGTVAPFGWNSTFKVQEKGEHTFIGAPSASAFSETWYWAKNSEDQNPKSWVYSTLLKFVENNGGTYTHLFFGTASEGGRYDLLVNPSNGGFLELFHGETVANSYSKNMGATETFGKDRDLEIEMGKTYKITIVNVALENGKAMLKVYVNNILAMTYETPGVVEGDFGFGVDAGMTTWIGDTIIAKETKLAINADEYKEHYFDLKESVGDTSVGENAPFGWNSTFNVQENGDNLFIAPPSTGAFAETWFYAKDSNDMDPNMWEYTTTVKFVENNGGTYTHLFFGTASEGGRYDLLVNPSNGGSVELFHGELVANSFDETKGATLMLGSGRDMTFEMGGTYKITIQNILLENGNAKLKVFVDDILVMTYVSTGSVIGDFGFGVDAGMTTWIGNTVIAR